MKLKTTLAALTAALIGSGCASLQPAQPAARAMHPALNADAAYRLGRYLQGQLKFDGALHVYADVLAAQPGHVDALNAIGVIHSQQGDAERAESAFRAALAEAPDSARTHNNLGYHLLTQGRAAEALAHFERALALAPQDEQAQVNLARARHESATAPLQETAGPEPAIAPQPQATLRLDRVAESVYELRQPGQPATAAAPQALGPVQVEISNGNGVTGLARRVSQLLELHARLTNTKPFNVPASRIEYVPGAEQAARAVNEKLPVALPLAPVKTLERQAAVRVLLGKDFPKDPAVLAAQPNQQAAL